MRAEDWIYVGRVLKSRGLKGELKVQTEDTRPDRFQAGMEFFLEDGRQYVLSSYRQQGSFAYLFFQGITSLDLAKPLVGQALYLEESALPKTSQDSYYVKDLLDSGVYEGNHFLGRLVEVIEGPRQDLYRVLNDAGEELLIPGVKAFIQSLDPKAKRIQVRLIEGMRHAD